MKKFGLFLLGLLIVLVVSCAVFLLVAFIVSTKNNIDFVEQLKIWFGIATKENVASATQTILSFIK